MAKVYVGGIDVNATEADIEDEFKRFGVLRNVWVARKPPGFAFVEFESSRDADDAIRKLDGFQNWRVELSRKGERGGGGGRGYGGGGGGYDRGPPRGGGGMRSDSKCYSCGESGHFARECPNGGGGGGGGGGGYRDSGRDRYGDRDRDRGRYRSRSPRRSRSPAPRRSPSLSPRRDRRSPSY